jgi:hypothetical protein
MEFYASLYQFTKICWDDESLKRHWVTQRLPTPSWSRKQSAAERRHRTCCCNRGNNIPIMASDTLFLGSTIRPYHGEVLRQLLRFVRLCHPAR